MTWTVLSACAAPQPLTPGNASPPLEQKNMLGLELEPQSDVWLIDNPSASPVFAPSCGALKVRFEWRTRSGWQEAPTFIHPFCGGCSSDVDAAMPGTSTHVSCNDALVAGTYRARVRLVDTHGKVFDLVRALDVAGLSDQASDAFVDMLMQPETLACLRFDTFRQVVDGFAWVGTRAAVRRLRDVRTGEPRADADILSKLSFVPDGIDDLALMAEQPGERALAAQLAFSADLPCDEHPDVPPCKKIIEGWLGQPVHEELMDALVRAIPMNQRDDAVFRDHLIAAIPSASVDAIPTLLFVLFSHLRLSQADITRALPLMKRRQSEVSGAARDALAEAITEVQLRAQGYATIGRPPLQRVSPPPTAACGNLERRLVQQLFAETRATLESKGHLPMKTVGNASATWNGERVESPGRVLACTHRIRFCE